MKYKVGDRVRIKSLDWYNENKDEDGYVDGGRFFFDKEMTKFCGKVLKIVSVLKESYYMDDGYCNIDWTDEMIEGLWEEETKPEPKFKAGNRVFNLSTKESVNIVEYDEETGLYTIIYDDGLKGRSFEDGLKRIEHITWDDVDEKTVSEKILEARDKHYWDMLGGESKNEITLPQGYQFKDENGNVINTNKIVLEKEPDNKLKLESTKKVREYWSEYTRIFIEIYDDEPNECVLTHLYTLEGHRQKGYGRQALSEAEEIAKELSCHTAYLKVETCSWMHNWYLRCGYNWYKNADEGYTWLTKNL